MRSHRTRRASAALAAGAAALLMLAGCAAGPAAETAGGDPGANSPGDAAPADGTQGDEGAPGGSLDAEAILGHLEGEGFACTKKKRTPKVIAEAYECKTGDGVILTANRFDDPREGVEYFRTSATRTACKVLKSITEVRWSMNGDWMLVPGADNDAHTSAHEAAAKALGFTHDSQPCE